MTIVIQQISTQESSRCGEKLGDKGKELRVVIVVHALVLYNSCSHKRDRIRLDGDTFSMKMLSRRQFRRQSSLRESCASCLPNIN
jgi:hypothetical protein